MNLIEQRKQLEDNIVEIIEDFSNELDRKYGLMIVYHNHYKNLTIGIFTKPGNKEEILKSKGLTLYYDVDIDVDIAEDIMKKLLKRLGA